MTNTATRTTQHVAQELVALRQQLIQLEAQMRSLKQELLSTASPGQTICCDGGRVSVVDGGTVNQLDPKVLAELLWERGIHLSVGDAESLMRDGKVERPRDPYVAVRLD